VFEIKWKLELAILYLEPLEILTTLLVKKYVPR